MSTFENFKGQKSSKLAFLISKKTGQNFSHNLEKFTTGKGQASF